MKMRMEKYVSASEDWKTMKDNSRKVCREIEKALGQEEDFKLDMMAHYFFNPICIAKGYLMLALEEKNGEIKILKAIEAINRVENVVKNVVTNRMIRE